MSEDSALGSLHARLGCWPVVLVLLLGVLGLVATLPDGHAAATPEEAPASERV